jgi:peptide/nickel transport system substrate-binding protein
MTRTLSRRAALAAMTSAGVAFVGACRRGGDPGHAPGAQDTPRPGGNLLFAFDGAAVTQFALDPHKSAFAPHHRIMRSIFDSLVVARPGHRFGPWLARSWEMSPDARSYTFHLRDDVTFHDGTRFDAAAVKENLDRIANPKNALFALSDLGPYEAADVVDPLTVRVRFSAGFAPFLINLSKTSLGIHSPKALREFGDRVEDHPTGTGPFRLRSTTPGTEVALERNPDYRWAPEGAAHDGPAWLERLTFRNVPEESTRVAVLRSGQAAGADLVPPQNLLELRASPEFRVLEAELLNHNYSLFFNTNRAPWNDAKLREAFRLSLDLDAAVKTVYLGTFSRAWSPLSPSIFGYDRSLEGSWAPDRESARRSLDALGWTPGPDGVRVKDGKRLSVVIPDSQGNREKRLDLLTLLRHQLRESGFDVRIESQSGGTLLAKIGAGDFDVLAASQFAPDPDVLRRIYTPLVRSQFSVAKVDDAELNRILGSASEEAEPAARAQLYAQAQRRIVAQTYAIPAYVLLYNLVTASRARDVAIDLHGFPTFHGAWLAS